MSSLEETVDLLNLDYLGYRIGSLSMEGEVSIDLLNM